jgi:hypothetical protein
MVLSNMLLRPSCHVGDNLSITFWLSFARSFRGYGDSSVYIILIYRASISNGIYMRTGTYIGMQNEHMACIGQESEI